jgi:hypothetical protein
MLAADSPEVGIPLPVPLESQFAGGHHQRRIDKITEMERAPKQEV